MNRLRWHGWACTLVGLSILFGTLMAFLGALDSVLQGAWYR